MTTTTPQPNQGFLDGDFLADPFLDGASLGADGCQVQMQIVDALAAVGAQAELFRNDALTPIGGQAELVIADALKAMNAQVHAQVLDFLKQVSAQAEMHIEDSLQLFGFQVASSNILYQICGGFLDGGFMMDPFLAARYCAHAGAQVAMYVEDFPDANGAQAEFIIADDRNDGLQVEMQVTDYPHIEGMQILAITARAFGCQVRFVLYNTNRPRILVDFPSRGATGQNWTASSTEPGDYSVNNLNNDIVEFYWRSASGVDSGVTLTCDTEVVSGVSVDTIALLEHNLSRAATVIFQGSDFADFSVVGLEVTLPAMTRNTFWVSPDLPLNQYRYYRFLISDNTNPDGFIRIGTIVFGSAVIFQGECAEQRVTLGRTHFKQENPTEGHTSVDQDLALKKRIRINFPNLDAQRLGNYDSLDEIFEFARTSLKCLWIVDPRPVFIQRLSIFGKLTSLPDEEHNAITSDEFRVSLAVEIDEAK